MERDSHGLDYSVGKLTTTVRRDRRGDSVLFYCRVEGELHPVGTDKGRVTREVSYAEKTGKINIA